MTKNSRFIRACRCEPVDRVPAWIMRQAGRYLPEYRELRKKHDFLTVCRTPELATEVTLQPLRRFPLDAAILFSDILIPVAAMGCDVAFTPAPVFPHPVRSAEDVAALHVPDPADDMRYVTNAIRMLKTELGDTPLIGFSGAPITLATYMIEGGSSKTFTMLRRFMATNPDATHSLLRKLTDTVARYLLAQIEAGVDAVQIFDTWAGLLSPIDYEAWALPDLQQIVRALKPSGVPIIYYANGAGMLLNQIGEIGADVIGIDWRTPLCTARKILGEQTAVQGNLDPCALFAPATEIDRKVQEVFESAGNTPGHIFNLGHGILPETPIEAVEALIAALHTHGTRVS